MLFFAYFGVSDKRNIKRNKIFKNVIFSPNVIHETWTPLQGIKEVVTRVGGMPPCLVGPSMLHRRTPSSYIYTRTPKQSEQEAKT